MSKIGKIRRVVSINQQGSDFIIVGWEGVAEIRDNSVEFENSIHNQFDAYDKDGQLLKTFINGALSVEYFPAHKESK